MIWERYCEEKLETSHSQGLNYCCCNKRLYPPRKRPSRKTKPAGSKDGGKNACRRRSTSWLLLKQWVINNDIGGKSEWSLSRFVVMKVLNKIERRNMNSIGSLRLTLRTEFNYSKSWKQLTEAIIKFQDTYMSISLFTYSLPFSTCENNVLEECSEQFSSKATEFSYRSI